MTLEQQIRQRRKQMRLTQADMKDVIGMSQQQYQRVESGHNATLESLQTVAEGLGATIMLIPQDKIDQVNAVLADEFVNELRLTASPSE